jgi:hypothetical protein
MGSVLDKNRTVLAGIGKNIKGPDRDMHTVSFDKNRTGNG